MNNLTELKNIGQEMSRKLSSIGIDTVAKFQETGVLDTFIMMKASFPDVCLVHLQVLQGAYDGVDYTQLNDDVKQELKSFYTELFE